MVYPSTEVPSDDESVVSTGLEEDDRNSTTTSDASIVGMNSDGDDIDDADYFHDCAEEEEYIFYDCNETASIVDH